MVHRLDQIAASQRITRTMHGNGTWQCAEFVFVHNDHSGRLSVGRLARCEPPLGVTQPLVDALELTA